jgi:hypothetical protein
MACPICMINFPTYVIECGHEVCEGCEVELRMKDTRHLVKCPVCQVTETKSGVRTPKSYETELSQLYEQDDQWTLMAIGVRTMSIEKREQYIAKYPRLRAYFPLPRGQRLPPRQYVEEPILRERTSRRVTPVSASWSTISSDSDYQTAESTSSSSSTEYKSIYCQGVCGVLTKDKCTQGCGRYVCTNCSSCLFH